MELNAVLMAPRSYFNFFGCSAHGNTSKNQLPCSTVLDDADVCICDTHVFPLEQNFVKASGVTERLLRAETCLIVEFEGF